MSIEVINGNVFDVLPTLAEKSFNCCVTSPPYWNLRDYGQDGQLGSETLHDCLGWATGNPCGECFVCHMVDVGRGVKRVLRDDGVFWLNLGDSYAGSMKGICADGRACGGEKQQTNQGSIGISQSKPDWSDFPLKNKDLCGIPWRVALALQADGWFLRRDCIWSKPNPMPESVTDRPTTAHEYVFLFSKSQQYWYDADSVRVAHARLWDENNGGSWASASREDDPVKGKAGTHRGKGYPVPNPLGRNLRSVWEINTVGFPGSHFAVFPPELVQTCVLAGCPPYTCSACGKPHVRITEKTVKPHPNRGDSDANQFDATNNTYNPKTAGSLGRAVERTTLGWQATCDCNADTIPGTVLDPFSGAGTTGVVCRDIGLNYVGIELNPEYAQMSRDRIADPDYEKKLRTHQRIERQHEHQPALF